MRVLATSLLLISVLIPRAADAQVLTVEIEALVDAPVADAPVADARVGSVVFVRPDGDARIAVPPLRTADVPAQVVTTPVRDDDENIEGWGHLAFFADRMDLDRLELTVGSGAEIEAVRGLALGSEWAGRDGLRDAVTGGITFGFGMRAAEYVRGPDIRFSLGGGDVEGSWARVQGAPDGIELSVQSIFFLRAELALGLQLPLGPVTPYVIGIGSVGIGLIDVAVRDATLGRLGTETIEAGLFSAGFEAGFDVEVEEGLELGFAFRANVVGTTSMGGVFRIGFGGE